MATADTADIILKGGPIITMDPRNPRAEALAVRDGRIVSVGKLDQINTFKGKDTRIVDLEGRTVMPGLPRSPLAMPGIC